MVIGQSGAGKSTFINMIANAFEGGSLDNLKVAIPTIHMVQNSQLQARPTETGGDGTKSQTSDCAEYVFRSGSTTFTVVDTPGLADSAGPRRDEANVQKILLKAESLQNLSALIFLANGTQERMGADMSAVFARFQGSLPNSVLKNIFLVLSKCKRSSHTFQSSSLFFEPVRTFYFDNTCFATPPSSWCAADRSCLAADFQQSLQTIQDLVAALGQSSLVVQSADFAKLRSLRFEVKQLLHECEQKVCNLQKVQESLEQSEREAAASSQQAQQNKNYMTQKAIQTTEFVDESFHSTVCRSCNHVCHHRCGLNEISTEGSNAFLNCCAFNGASSCVECPGRCGHQTHYHSRRVPKVVTKSVEDILQPMKAKFDAAQKGLQAATAKIKDSAQVKKLIVAEMRRAKDAVLAKSRQVKEICSQFNFVQELHADIQQLRARALGIRSVAAHDAAMTTITFFEQIADELSRS